MEEDEDVIELIESTDSDDLVQSVIRAEYFINIDSEMGVASDYRAVFQTLRKATSKDTVHIILDTPGGVTATAIHIADMIMRCKAKVIARVYQAASGGSLITFACDEIQVADLGYIMIHCLSSGVNGKQEDMKTTANFLSDWGSLIYSSYKGFLTDVEIELVKQGKEYWFLKDEIEKRLKNWVSPKRK